MTKTFYDEIFGFLNFVHWGLFDISKLTFGISISQWIPTKQIPPGDNQSLALPPGKDSLLVTVFLK
jgi:hypothetical protein